MGADAATTILIPRRLWRGVGGGVGYVTPSLQLQAITPFGDRIRMLTDGEIER